MRYSTLDALTEYWRTDFQEKDFFEAVNQQSQMQFNKVPDDQQACAVRQPIDT